MTYAFCIKKCVVLQTGALVQSKQITIYMDIVTLSFVMYACTTIKPSMKEGSYHVYLLFGHEGEIVTICFVPCQLCSLVSIWYDNYTNTN